MATEHHPEVTDREQRAILDYLHRFGGFTVETAEREGWTWRHGLPRPALRELITRRIVAPRVLTSIPLRVVWQLRDRAHHGPTLAQIEREASRLRLKEYAQGGFRL